MIVLGVDATEIIPEITPIEMNRDPVAEAWVGRKVDASGYGETYDSSTTGRSFASVEIIDFDGETVIVDGKRRARDLLW